MSSIDELRKAAKCVYIATEEAVADDLARILNAAADRIAELEAENGKLRKVLEHIRFYALDNVPEELREMAKTALGGE